MIYLIIFFAIIQRSSNALGSVFTFRRSNNLERISSWSNSQVPCVNDRIVFDANKVLVTVLNSAIDIRQIVLPDNGMIFFGKSAKVGEVGEWQCKSNYNKSNNEAFFETDSALNFFNPSNWFVASDDVKYDSLLHAYQVPSREDSAVMRISDAYRVLINTSVELSALSISNQVGQFL
ncbi:hypothetical protein AB6A40_004511 [Gnathostoma spinigerum]|uniref:Protein amnionless n=1 Tax=Gnathostoma spinigerum TaxID=75299 RepID=A0ABD6EEV3_9BILA